MSSCSVFVIYSNSLKKNMSVTFVNIILSSSSELGGSNEFESPSAQEKKRSRKYFQNEMLKSNYEYLAFLA